jgi:hypothetical protein
MKSDADDAPFARLGLMGGCGSSGTTLLVHLLSRHEEIGSGPEFNCFNHPEVYNLPSLRRAWPAMRRGRARPAGYIDVPVFMTHREHYRVDDQLIERWLAESASATEFVTALKDHLHSALDCHIVLEKSPTNVYCFRQASETLDGVRIVHLVRDGRDVVVSLMRRGFNLFGAGSRWLYDTVRGLEARGSPAYLEARYEDLVSDPDGTCEQLLRHFGAGQPRAALEGSTGRRGEYNEQWLNRAEPRAWNQRPSDPISSRSVGQFREKLSPRDLDRLERISLHRSVRAADGLPRTFGDLIRFLGYPTEPGPVSEQRDYFADRQLEFKDYLRRLKRFQSRNDWTLPKRFTRFARATGESRG